MSDDLRHKYPIWDRLFLLLYPCDDSVTNAVVDEELERLGIDMKPAFQRLHNMIESQRARANLARAGETRASLCEQIHNVVAPRMADLRNGVKSMIGKLKGDQAQLAYFHKLEGAATEEDLQSLLDDLEKLETMQELQNDQSE